MPDTIAAQIFGVATDQDEITDLNTYLQSLPLAEPSLQFTAAL